VRAVDLVCLLVACVAVIVAMSGGFRVRLGDWRIALTSPYRLLFWAVVVSVIRHVAAPAAPIYRDLPRRIAGWWRVPGVASAATVVAWTCPAILFVGYLAVVMFGYAGGQAPVRSSDNEIINLPHRWDAGWYLAIVTEGYSYVPNQPEMQQPIVFFPAYPMLMRGAGRLLGGTVPSYLLGGVLVSYAAFLGALTYFYGFARDYLDDDQATSAQWLLAAYPFALFYGAIYVESLFLLGIIGSFYHFTRRQYWRAAGWGLLVGLTKATGFELSAPLGVLAVSPWLPQWLAGGPAPPQRHDLFKASIAVAAPCVGVAIFSAYLWNLTGHPLAWLEGHAAWGRTYQGLTTLVADRYDYISRAGLAGYVSTLPYDLLNGLSVVFVLAAAWPVARRLGLAYGIFIVAMILPPLSSGGLLSAGRFSSVLFPAFIWLAGAVPRPQRVGWVAMFAAIQAFNAALFYTWHPLY
jgi:hypothetical protein